MSAAIAALIAQLTFPILPLLGWARGEIGLKGTIIFVILGLGAWVGLPRVFSSGRDFVPSALAIIDIALVMVLFKADVRLW
jgi:hypothetical protein